MRRVSIGIYGGTFDPIHWGHINAANQVQQKLGFDEVRMVLSARPPHRTQPIVSASDRFSLLGLALQDQPTLYADDCELKRSGPSYMVDTLLHYRKQAPESSIALILGMEAFNGLMSWHRWQDIIELAHIVITDRAGFNNQLETKLATYVEPFISTDKTQLKLLTHGKIYSQPVEPLAISATQLRQLLKNNEPVSQWVPDASLAEIQRHGFYS